MRISKNNLIVMVAVAGILSLFFSCDGNRHRSVEVPFDAEAYREPLMQANKQVTRNEDDLIVDFIKRYGWHMVKTGTGLRYMIYHNGDGGPVQKGDEVTINYSVMLLNGDSVYSSQTNGPMVITAGTRDVESGLEEGILLLHHGDKAKFILPSHLAFGLLGDFDKIPQKATLVYDVEVLNIKRK
jgi:FKBP-type peptidyl-prolyl cis-trans isomerase FkpA